MAEIDAEVRRRRASGDLPVGLEQELDELFLEFSPVGLHGKARLRETLSLVDRSAYVDIAVPVASKKLVGTYVKRLIRKGMGWYIGFIVHQIVKFAWSVSRMFHVVVDHVEDLEAAVEVQRTPPLPATVVPSADPGTLLVGRRRRGRGVGEWSGRVLHADCGTGTLLDALVAAGVDAYGVDPDRVGGRRHRWPAGSTCGPSPSSTISTSWPTMPWPGLVVTGSVEWLHPNERDRLVTHGGRRAWPSTACWCSTPPRPSRGWAVPRRSSPTWLPGRPLHAETWSRLLGDQGFRVDRITYGGIDRRHRARGLGQSRCRRPQRRHRRRQPGHCSDRASTCWSPSGSADRRRAHVRGSVGTAQR